MKRPTAPTWSRVAVLAASLALFGAYVLPLWKITLEAPQYPEGLGLLITVNTITGVGPHDLSNINNLNHYIGMKPIEPDSIAELRLMPWILAALIAWGIAAAAVGRRWMICGFFGLLGLAALAGLADFWRWGYDYGHNLDVEHAAIRIPGMAYQPPLIGSKKLLNFTAHSWPATGGWIAIAAGVAAALACLGGRIRVVRKQAGAAVILLGASVFLSACGPGEAAPIAWGEDVCEHCVMAIDEPAFAAEFVTAKGKVHRFDSIECLAGWLLTRDGSELENGEIWVTDFGAPGTWLRLDDARFVRDSGLRSPMGMGLAAMSRTSVARDLLPGAEELDWPAVLRLVRASDGRARGHGAGHSHPGPGQASDR